MSITIEEGKFYRRRDGKKAGPMARHPNVADTSEARNDGLWTCVFNDTGLQNKDPCATNEGDLVAEWVEHCELGHHYRGLGTDECTICGATPEQVDAQARAAMCDASHAAAEQRERMGHGMGGPVSEGPDFDALAYVMKGSDPNSMFVAGTSHLMGVEALTEERKSTHGNWTDQAVVGVMLDQAVQDSTGYANLAAYQRKAVDMILVKVSRIVSGDPSHADHWDDIAGYAHLGKGGHNSA